MQHLAEELRAEFMEGKGSMAAGTRSQSTAEETSKTEAVQEAAIKTKTLDTCCTYSKPVYGTCALTLELKWPSTLLM